MRRIPLLIAGAIGLAFATACRGASSDDAVAATPGGTAASPSASDLAKPGTSMVRFVDALPAPSRVELSGDDRTLFRGVKYKDVTAYAEVTENLIAFRLMRDGAESALADEHAMMRDGERYTVVVLPVASGPPKLVVLHNDSKPAAEKARLRVINASPTARTADVAIQGEREPLVKGVSSGDEACCTDVDPRVATIEIRRHAKGASTVLIKDVHLVAGKAYTVVIAGGGAAAFEAFTIEDAPALAPVP